MALSEDDRPQNDSELARQGTEPHGSTTNQDRRSVDPRGHAGPAIPSAADRQPAGTRSFERSPDDPGLPAGGSRQETGLHGKPATGGGSNEHARLPEAGHRDL